MKKFGGISKILAVIAFVIAVGFGMIYLKITIPSGRELWRIRDNSLSNRIVVNDFLLFEGINGESPSRWESIY